MRLSSLSLYYTNHHLALSSTQIHDLGPKYARTRNTVIFCRYSSPNASRNVKELLSMALDESKDTLQTPGESGAFVK